MGVHTVSQASRTDHLVRCSRMVAYQTHGRITEWVIGNGCRNAERAQVFSDWFCAFFCVTSPVTAGEGAEGELARTGGALPVKVRLLPWVPGRTLAAVRQQVNTALADVDTVVCFDDDDFYPPCRVEHCLQRLDARKNPVVGSSAAFMFHPESQQFYRYAKLRENHSVHNTLAFTQGYARKHRYDTSKEWAEEASFLDNYRAPLRQLDPARSCVHIIHDNNTFSKIPSMCRAAMGAHSNWTHVPGGLAALRNELGDAVDSEEAAGLLGEVCGATRAARDRGGTEPEADVVVYCGCVITPPWDPTSTCLGGSEQSVVGLATAWAKAGRSVVVYSNFDFLLQPHPAHMAGAGRNLSRFVTEKARLEGAEIGGVRWKHSVTFDFLGSYRNLVLWRLDGTGPALALGVQATNLITDVHDNCEPQVRAALAAAGGGAWSPRVDHARAAGGQAAAQAVESVVQVVPNGITVPLPNQPVAPRNPYSFVYSSCYTRGLLPLLCWTWPAIFAKEPRAELHVYYGMGSIRDQTFRQNLIMALAQPGVMDHGRQPREEVARMKSQSAFHLYWTETKSETDCMAVRESLAFGCIPLLRPQNVFLEREGLFWEPPAGLQVEEQYKQLADWVLQTMDAGAKGHLDEKRSQLSSSSLLVGWEEVAARWPLLPVHKIVTDREEGTEKHPDTGREEGKADQK